jgi:hypothetical protein
MLDPVQLRALRRQAHLDLNERERPSADVRQAQLGARLEARVAERVDVQLGDVEACAVQQPVDERPHRRHAREARRLWRRAGGAGRRVGGGGHGEVVVVG